MFQSARLKLTLWYLLIIMSISLFFSGIIYRSVSFEVQSRLSRIEERFPEWQPGRPMLLLVEDLAFVKRRVLLMLFYLNGVILAVAGAAGYFLAGKTLNPIEAALEEQKRFVADASHELRTPLTALKTSIEVTLRQKKLTVQEAKAVLQGSLEEVDGLELLTSRLLSLARYQQTDHGFALQPVDISTVMTTAAKKVAPLAQEKKIDLKVSKRAQLVTVDIKSVEEMLLIFLDNALKYTPSGGQVSLIAKTSNKNLILEIKDTGIGIAAKDLPHIFDRFYRADQSRSKAIVPGFGLGLALAKKIIDKHHGAVKASSRPGQGTTFTVKLPL
ncbi:hypothetical protein COT66_02245 [Candidatus Shapirobacteria bacterium CG09_land_8_20_14_0_10_49_15]|uniref:histidine kinase n=2 Tax=Candidatus Shapironibacteriota TaxID=1752721 RepID=A0A2M8L7Q2_9BACT|nr:MAG: hypothetical protein COT66_02245 [Candidatus Shapirobacteria bacterium CG09_land_8_20_14_0_10_49_15]PJE70228.1 MAG: hypothetical protein COU97_00720 [Candidatus Shapirobacteria bacterium CG10_big_fil_rev_8_21_14_0_10_48_15]